MRRAEKTPANPPTETNRAKLPNLPSVCDEDLRPLCHSDAVGCTEQPLLGTDRPNRHKDAHDRREVGCCRHVPLPQHPAADIAPRGVLELHFEGFTQKGSIRKYQYGGTGRQDSRHEDFAGVGTSPER